MYFTKCLKSLFYNRLYIFYALAYGLSSLVIPLAVQFLVNNLSLSGIWANIVTFLAFVSGLLILAQVFKYSQVIIMEYLQRQLFKDELTRWQVQGKASKAHYYLEIPNLLKSFSKTYTDLIEISLVSLFGLITLVIFHPAFLFVLFLFSIGGLYIRKTFIPALKTSIQESNEKYHIHDKIASGAELNDEDTIKYVTRRDHHFNYVRNIAFKVGIIQSLSQIFVLVIGCYLIYSNQLSVGQLVAAEIIMSGIGQVMIKLPNSLEALFDFETSHYKIDKALSSPEE